RIAAPLREVAGIPPPATPAPAAAATSTVETPAVKTAAVKISAMETAAVKPAAAVRTTAAAARFRNQGLHDDESRCQSRHGDAYPGCRADALHVLYSLLSLEGCRRASWQGIGCGLKSGLTRPPDEDQLDRGPARGSRAGDRG